MNHHPRSAAFSLPPADPFARWTRGVVYTALILVVTLLSLNAHDSGVVKMPLFALGALLVLALLGSLSLRSTSLTLPLSASGAALVLYGLLAVTGWVRTAPAAGATDGLLFIISCAAFFVAGVRLWTARSELDMLQTVVTWVSAAVIAVGVMQVFFADSLAVEFYLGPAKRIGSLLGNPAFLAGYVVLVAPLIAVRGFTRASTGARVFSLSVAAGLCVLLLVTESRSGLAGAVCAGVLFTALVWERSSGRTLLPVVLGSVLALAAAIMIIPGLGDRIAGTFAAGPASTYARRTYFWKAGLAAFTASPLTGHGPGSFERVMGSYREPEYWIVKSEDIVPHAHNEFLETAVDSGSVGLLCLVIVLAFSLFRAARRARTGERWLRLPAAALFAGVVGLVVDNLTSVSLRQAPVAAPAWLLLGIMGSSLFVGQGGRSVSITLPRFRFLWFVPLLAWIAFAVWYVPRSVGEVRGSALAMSGILRTGAGDHTGAIEDYRKALVSSPNLMLARTNLAAEYVQTRRPAEALQEAEELQLRYPDYPRTWLVKGISYWLTGRNSEALAALEREKRLRNHPEVFHIESLVYRKLNDSTGESAALEQVLRQCLRGGVTQHLEYAVQRLPALVHTETRVDSLVVLYRELERAFPDQAVVARARRQFGK
jgi:O-antigen ligase